MKLEIGQRITVVSKIGFDDGSVIKSQESGMVIESVNPKLYPFTLQNDDGAVSPIFSIELNETYFLASDITEKTFLTEAV